MNYTILEVNGKEHKLRLTIEALCEIERSLGDNPLNLIMNMREDGKIPSVYTITEILYRALKSYQSNITKNVANRIFQDYIDEGHQFLDLVTILFDVFVSSGVIGDEPVEDEERKN